MSDKQDLVPPDAATPESDTNNNDLAAPPSPAPSSVRQGSAPLPPSAPPGSTPGALDDPTAEQGYVTADSAEAPPLPRGEVQDLGDSSVPQTSSDANRHSSFEQSPGMEPNYPSVEFGHPMLPDTSAHTRALPEYTPRKAELGRIPSPSPAEKRERARQEQNRNSTKAKLPTGAVRLATVSMSKGGGRGLPKPRSHFVDSSLGRRKVITWDEAMNSRPPLRIDMDGPTACSYTPRSKPPYETNAPSWTFGARCYVEKDAGGSRTSWEKSWFQTPHLYQHKTDFHHDHRWPSPSHYQIKPTVGARQQTMVEYPAFSIGVRRAMEINKKGSETEPSPGEYESDKSLDRLRPRAPAFSHGRRRGGTILWTSNELSTPGPGSYNPDRVSLQQHRPAYTIQGMRREKSHVYGPFATF